MSKIREYLSKFNKNGEGNQLIINEIQKKLNINLPRDYIEFMSENDGGEGFIGENYCIFYKTEELLAIQDRYEVNNMMPGIFIIGNNGGSEAFAIDLRESIHYILVPFLFEEEAIIIQGKTFESLLDRIYLDQLFE